MTKNQKVLLSIFIVLLSIWGGTHLFKATKLKIDLYNNLVSSVENKNWDSAKSSLDQLGNYRNSLSYTDEVNFQYYLTNGDKEYSNKNYNNALDLYYKAHNYKKEDKNLHKNLQIKINKTENQIKIQKAEEARKAAIAKAKAERQNRQELADLERLVKQAFVKTYFLNDQLTTAFNFYVYPEIWYQQSIEDQQNIFASCVRYVELKTGVDKEKAYYHTRIINIDSNLPVASYTLFE